MKWWAESKKKKVCTTLNYNEHFLILVSVITGCISIFSFDSLLGICIGIMSPVIGLKVYATSPGINRYKSIIKKNKKKKKRKKKKHDKIVLLAIFKLNRI